ncbi:hypothetical protein [Fretibacter rubidus]|uniref:hypothetical protein n=1 Tax=Fretibacter rubidus TaxID=570162 RepID=UPI00352B2484
MTMNTKQSFVKIALVSAGLALMATPAQAADYQINVRSCPNAKGSVTIEPANAMAWDSVKSNNPTEVMNSMVSQSNCFTNGNSGMRYILRYGPLTQAEFAAGPSSFSGRSVLEPAPAVQGGIPQAGGGIPQSGGGIPQASNGSSQGGGFSLGSVDQMLGTAQQVERGANSAEYYAKNVGNGYNDIGDVRGGLRSVDGVMNTLGGLGGLMGSSNKAPKDRYAYVEVVNSAGQVLARGFGHNARADLSFASFSGAKSFAKNKKSRRQGGALYNAFNDAQNRIMSPSFGVPIQ